MTKLEHTPGPWRFEPGTNTIRSVPANYWLASLDSWDGAVRPHHEGNAQLMATAPQLLEAAQGAIASAVTFSGDESGEGARVEITWEAYHWLKDAIAKAVQP